MSRPATALGLGCMALSGTYGPPDRVEGVAVVRAALDAGITLLDTGDFYGMGDNELLLAHALRGVPRDRYRLSVKFGMLRAPDGRFLGVDGRPAAVKTSLAYSLRRLGTEYIDVYRLSRVDPVVPIEDTVGAIADMVRAGYVRAIGLSEAGVSSIRRAHAVHPLADVQLEYSLASRGVERRILPTCREMGVPVSAYGVLARGLLGGRWRADRPLRPGDIRARFPRFAAGNLATNLGVVEALGRLAGECGTSVGQLAFAWVLAQGDDIVPLVGARTREQLQDALGALEVELSAQAIARAGLIASPATIHGERYDAHQMQMLDSERDG